MLIFGHDYFKIQPFYDISSIDAILKTPSHSTLYIDFDDQALDIIEHCQLNNLPFALSVKNLREAIYAHNFNASYIITTRILAPMIQKSADTYLFDAKILSRIEDESEIEELASLGIDGVIFPSGIVKGTP
ncbi:MAG: hypothetical protein OEW60_07815 [Thiovulaceae bacterium]|nr:hypothetical protein [Sulfurimonadaceae bacterium]